MRRMPILLSVLLALAVAGSAGLAQVETPVAGPPATPLATPQATPQLSLAGVAPLPLTDERRAAFEAYVADALHRLGVPGASVAVVQGGDVVYLQGFGVRAIGADAPVTPDTLLGIGSVTKSMTSTMAATLVDAGWLAWDTPLVDLLPGFAVADPQLTPRLTVADSFCACTGLPRRDPELIFNFHALTPERLIAQVADFPLTTPFGETFQYSNQMYAIGGYAAAAAAGAAPDDLLGGYQLAMRDRLLNPIGMGRSTFALEEVLASGDYALPHAADLDGRTQAVPLLVDDGFLNSVAPAGALWSSAREMARYLQTELADGVAPDGTRVVSAENLLRTRAPRVAIPAPPDQPYLFSESAQAYGLGWLVGAYKGQPLISHNGGTFGFASEVAFLPEADLGFVILTNDVARGGPFTYAVQYRLLELLFDQPAEIDPLLTQLLEGGGSEPPPFGQVDAAAVAPYLGRYTNSALGEVQLRLEGERLVLDAGEVRSALRPLVDEAGQVTAYVFADPPLAGAPTPVTLRQGADGRPEVVVTVEGENPEATQTYVFTQVEASAAATPAP
jgi:CubicO group peptidase (beta-lactamase class C family)